LPSISIFSHTPTASSIYTLSLHDALPISHEPGARCKEHRELCLACNIQHLKATLSTKWNCGMPEPNRLPLLQANVTGFYLLVFRSEEHTSELQSRFDLVCRLLLEKKKKNK